MIGLEPGDHLVAQVVGHDLVVTVEPRDGNVNVRLRSDRQRRQVEAGGPALGAVHQRVQSIAREVYSGRGQHLVGL